MSATNANAGVWSGARDVAMTLWDDVWSGYRGLPADAQLVVGAALAALVIGPFGVMWNNARANRLARLRAEALHQSEERIRAATERRLARDAERAQQGF